MKKIFVYFSMALLPLFGIAQQIPDSVIIFIENRVKVIIEIEDYAALNENNDALVIIKRFQAQIPNILDELQIDKSEIVTYTDDSLLTIEDGNSKKVFLMNESELVNTGIRDEAVLVYKGLRIIISTNNLNSISNISIADCLQTVFDSLPEKSIVSQSLYYQCIDSKVTKIPEKNTKNSTSDFIGLNVGTGASLLKNTSLVDITFTADITFFKKGLVTHNGYVSANLMYDFLSNRKMNINTFLNVGYRFNLLKKRGSEHLFGVELGYLISRQGDLFDENTFRFSLSKPLNKYMVISPQLYIEDGFKRFYLGIRLGIGF